MHGNETQLAARSRERSFVGLAGFVWLLAAVLPGIARGQHATDRWGRNFFPNTELTTHTGKKVKFFDDLIKDKVVVINFIYTSCPDACPLETARLAEVQAILGERVGKDVFIYSITIDPAHDTPDVLARYAESYGAKDGWLFLTGAEADIVALRKRLGLYIEEIQSEGSNDHNINMLIGNQSTGRWMRRSPFENPYVLATQIGDWLHNWRSPRSSGRDYDSAPALRQISDGEGLFRTRCAACHTIGGAKDQIARSGPDLLGVTGRRERLWLKRWLAEPDKMLAAGDPIALDLFEKFDRVPMPNLRLSPEEIEQLLDFMVTESRRVEATRSAQAATESIAAESSGASCCEKGREGVLMEVGEAARSRRSVSRWIWVSLLLGLGLGLVSFIKPACRR